MKKGKKKWLIAVLAALVAVVEVVAPELTPVAEVVAEAVEPNVWASLEEPLPGEP